MLRKSGRIKSSHIYWDASVIAIKGRKFMGCAHALKYGSIPYEDIAKVRIFVVITCNLLIAGSCF